MAVGLIRDRDEHETALVYAFDFPFSHSQLRRIDEIVGRIHEHHGDADSLELGRRVVIPRGIHCLPNDVRIVAGDEALD